MTKLYHRDLGFPITFKYPSTKVELSWSKHAHRQAEVDRYGYINKMETLHTDDYIPIEIEYDIEKSKPIKMLLRSKFEVNGCNIVIALMPSTRGATKAFVKTVWYNKVDDTHKTLDASKYDIPAFKLKLDK